MTMRLWKRLVAIHVGLLLLGLMEASGLGVHPAAMFGGRAGTSGDSWPMLAAAMGMVWSLPSVCLGLVLGGAAAATVLGRTGAVWGAGLGTACGGMIAAMALLAEFQGDRLLTPMLAGTAAVPSAVLAGIAAILWAERQQHA